MNLENIWKESNGMEELDKYFSEQCDAKIQYASIESGIKAHAEDYSFNIESELFNQLTKEQQALWRKEIEQACISGGKGGVELARDPRYKENLEVKEVDLEKEIEEYIDDEWSDEWSGDVGNWIRYRRGITSMTVEDVKNIAKHFFELGMQASNPLTWEDMMTIHKCCKDAMNCNLYAWETAEGQQKIYEDVLKRFKAQKGE